MAPLLATRLSELRDATGIARADVAAHVDVDLFTLARWEALEPVPGEYVGPLADLFGVSVVWLLGEERDRS